MLPIVHATTAEELSIYLWGKILQGMDAKFLRTRGIPNVGQEATFRYPIPEELEAGGLDVRNFIENGNILPTPCLPLSNHQNKTKACDGTCWASQAKFSAALNKIAESMNNGSLSGQVTTEDLENLVK